MPSFLNCVAAVAVFQLFATVASAQGIDDKARQDEHSYSNPNHIKTTHLDLALLVDFDNKVLHGQVVLSLRRVSKKNNQPLILDTRDLTIKNVEISNDGREFKKTKFTLEKANDILGAALKIELPKSAKFVRIDYATSPKASALQWLSPEQTASKTDPFLFTQSQAIHARSWIPLQDTPGVRVTYNAKVTVPKQLFAVMSASNVRKKSPNGVYHFEMKQSIPSYLIALAVGNLAFQSVGPRTGVYAEPPVVGKAAREFADMEKMLNVIEKLYGPYRWERYDVLVLPPSFPFGGMENPRLTFATPTILAGDKSLISLIAHEMAHSWSGNLVSNATWRDFWLNEGFTVYLERRIVEAIYGRERAMMEAVLGLRSLQQTIKELKPEHTILYDDQAGRDPDGYFSDIPYEKGAYFLTHLEKAFGRKMFDAFLKSYFDHFAFQSITTPNFVDYLDDKLLKKNPTIAARFPIKQWVYQSGLPKSAPKLTAQAFKQVEREADQWLTGQTSLEHFQAHVKSEKWTTQQWLHFLRYLPKKKLDEAKLEQLDKTFELTKTGNSEKLLYWLLLSIQHQYKPAYPRLESFLLSMGRRWFLRELYAELAKTKEGKALALRIYAKARPTYHPISVSTVDRILGWKEE